MNALPTLGRSLCRLPFWALLLAPVMPPAYAAPQSGPQSGPAADLKLKDEIDLSIRWLRSVQDPRTGAYGGGVAGTAWVLRALAESPRRYARRDGPLVAAALDVLLARQAADGSLADEGARGSARLEQTRAAAAALAAHPDETTRAALGKALRWLGEHGVSDPDPGRPTWAGTKPEARERAVELLARRAPEGYWEGEQGRVIATARTLLELSHYEGLLAGKKRAAAGAKPLGEFTEADAEAVDAAILKGARFLLAAAEDGKWGAPGRPDAGITAMVLGALQTVPEPRPADVQGVIDAGLAWLVSLQREDGSIHQGRVANYVTSAAILALAASGDPGHAPAVLRARDWLIELQADEGEGYSEGDLFYGGIGYGGDERPDLSNLQMALEALSASGLDPGHEAFARAVQFLERCQNRSESNDTRVVDGEVVYVSGDDGGAGYYPGDSKAGFVDLPDGRKVPRSYGSMTYALLKSYVFAGLEAEDPRVEACWKWLQEHYTLDINPGMEHSPDPTAAYQGLFYYFHSMARALNVYGVDFVVDGGGTRHAWRPQLAGRLIGMQSKIDGSWVNENAPRWWEGNPVLATAYALLTLGETRHPR